MRLNATTESSWHIFGTTELSFEEKYRQAKAQISKMGKKERQELARRCFGMWEKKRK